MGKKRMHLAMRSIKGLPSELNVRWRMTMRPGLCWAFDKHKPVDALVGLKRASASTWSTRSGRSSSSFGYVKVRYRGHKRNTAQIVTLFALPSLWMTSRKLLTCMVQVHVQ